MPDPYYFRDLIKGFDLQDKAARKIVAIAVRAASAWKTETCETCEFQVDDTCRWLPGGKAVGRWLYPPDDPAHVHEYDAACAQWQRAAPTEKEKTDGERAS